MTFGILLFLEPRKKIKSLSRMVCSSVPKTHRTRKVYLSVVCSLQTSIAPHLRTDIQDIWGVNHWKTVWSPRSNDNMLCTDIRRSAFVTPYMKYFNIIIFIGNKSRWYSAATWFFLITKDGGHCFPLFAALRQRWITLTNPQAFIMSLIIKGFSKDPVP